MANPYLTAITQANQATLNNPNATALQRAQAIGDQAAHTGNVTPQLGNQISNYLVGTGANQQGQVLGAATSAHPPAVAAAPAPDYSGMLNDAKSSINRNYDALYKQLDSQAGFVDSDRQALVDQINSLYGSQQGDLDFAQQQSSTGLDRNAQQVQQRQADSFQTLSDSLRNLRTANQRQIGALGAGDSSANGQLDYALGRVNAQQATQISKQANDLLAQIDQKRQDLLNTRNDQQRKLDTWKTQNLQQINRDIAQRLEDIHQSRLNANRQQQAALDDAEAKVKQQGMAALQNIAAQSQNYAGVIDSHFSQNADFLSQAQQRIAGSGQNTGVDPTALQQSFDPGVGNFSGSTISPAVVQYMQQSSGLPAVSARPKQDNTIQSLFGGM